MMLRKLIKKTLYGRIPGFAGSFPYFGTSLHFPPGSLAFEAACDQGIYEHQNLRLILGLARAGTAYFDVGANIGLMAAPVLHGVRDVTVVSFEPSPNSLPYLRRSLEGSPYSANWRIVPAAVGAARGTRDFHASGPGHELLDGFVDTCRGRHGQTTTVQVTTVDHEWAELGRPAVSIIKIDVEGAEMEVLKGGLECLSTCRPSVLLEWNERNLAAYKGDPASLCHFAADHGFDLLSVPTLAPVLGPSGLRAHMAVTESFLLSPSSRT